MPAHASYVYLGLPASSGAAEATRAAFASGNAGSTAASHSGHSASHQGACPHFRLCASLQVMGPWFIPAGPLLVDRLLQTAALRCSLAH